MNSESQSPILKNCNSCRRLLPLESFGLLKSSRDMFNYTCRDCRNYKRRANFHKNSDELILPLNKNNLKVLNDVIHMNNVEIPSLLLNKGKLATLHLERQDQDYLVITIKYLSTKLYTFVLSDVNQPHIYKALAILFYQLNIRLLSSNEIESGHFHIEKNSHIISKTPCKK